MKGPTVRPDSGQARPAITRVPDIRLENMTLRSRPGGTKCVSPRMLVVAALAALATACSSISSASVPEPEDAAPRAAVSAGLVPVQVSVPAGMGASPFDTPRQVFVPSGWTMSVFARVPSARLAVWAPDGACLVSVPVQGSVVRLVPDGRGTASESVLLAGLNQPHGLTFAGSTLYVSQSDRVDAYAYSAGAAIDPRPVVTGLPDARSADLRGQYAHALKSVAVGPDGAVYVSVGSTGNISVDDLTARPPRASILRVPPGGGAPEPFAVGVRNGTGLAVAPDGAVWTAVNNRDNIQYPFDRPVRRGVGVVARPGHRCLRPRPPGRGAGSAHTRPEPGMAVLQPGPRRANPASPAPR